MAASGDRARQRRESDRFDYFMGKSGLMGRGSDPLAVSGLGKDCRDKELEDLLDELEAELRRDLHIDEEFDI